MSHSAGLKGLVVSRLRLSYLWVVALSVAATPVAMSAARVFAQTDVLPQYAAASRGLEYAHLSVVDGPWSIHIVRIDRGDNALEFVSALAQGTVYGLATVRRQVEALPKELGRPVAAVNADFFQIRPGPYQGDPTGMHVVEGELVSGPIGTGFWIDPAARPRIGAVYPRFEAAGPAGFHASFAFNQDRSDDKAVLYAPSMGPSTRTTGGVELVLAHSGQGPWLPLRAGLQYCARVTAVRHGGDSPIDADTLVLSLGPTLAADINVPAEGSIISVSMRTAPSLEGVRTAIGGGAILVKDGKAGTWGGRQPRHPRTVLGFNREHCYLVVVDGRQYGLSIGMSYPELAELMLGLGCTDAINLDGGGSSTLWLLGKVMNSPSDGRERAVANSLILVDTKTDTESSE